MMELLKLQKEEMQGYLPKLEIPENFVIAGGAIRRWFTGEKQNSDFDYFRIDGKEEYDLGIERLKESYSSIVQDTYSLDGKSIQVIKRQYESVSDLFSKFDFHHCQFAYNGDQIFTTKKAIISAMRKHLSFNDVIEGFEIDTLRRAFRYCKQGFSPCAGTIGDLANMLRDSDADFDEQVQMSPKGGTKTVVRFD